MRVLLVGPNHPGGSIPPYLDVLAAAMGRLGAHVDRIGSTGVPYDSQRGAFWPADQIVQATARLLDEVDLGAYDLCSLHFGNLEIEQLLPALLPRHRRTPLVYHVHSLEPTLFAIHVRDAALRAAVDQAIAAMDGYVFFGTYARTRLAQRANQAAPSVMAWLPTTIPPGTPAAMPHRLRDRLCAPDGVLTGSLYGYAAPWKDAATLLAASARATRPARLVLAGPFWDDPVQAGVDLTPHAAKPMRHGLAEVSVLAGYLGPTQRRALTAASDVAVFCYRPHPTFQGSGAIADYLAHRVPVVATDVANMAELVGDAGRITPPGDPDTLADALDRLSADHALRARLAAAARRRAHQFTADLHARACLRLYEQVLDTRRARP